MMWKRLLSVAASLVAACMVNGCGTSGAISSVMHSPPPPAQSRLYLEQLGMDGAGAIAIFALPITSASKPLGSIPLTDGTVIGLTFDPTGRLFATGQSGDLVFTQPIAAGSTPAFAVATGSVSAENLAFDRAGDLFSGGGIPFRCGFHECANAAIAVANSPINNSSTSSFTIGGSVAGFVTGLAFDGNGNLWVADGNLDEFVPPFSSSSTPALSLGTPSYSIAFDPSGAMYVSSSDGVDVYRPPFSASMTKAFSIAAAAYADYIAFDPAGNMYITLNNSSTRHGELEMFTPPFGSTSQPAVTLQGTTDDSWYYGVAIGP